MSRLVFLLLIARAVVAPVSLRSQLADRAAAGFGLHFLRDAAAIAPALPPQFDDGRPDGGLVIRVCYWPVPKSRHATSELARRVAKPRLAPWSARLAERLGESPSAHPLPAHGPTLSTEYYLRHALGQQRC
jgi:hypothetical protein